MSIKNFIRFIAFLSIIFIPIECVFSQSQDLSGSENDILKNANDYIVFGKTDTVFGAISNIDWDMVLYLKGIDYFNVEGNLIKLKKEDVEKITTFKVGRFIFDYVPMTIKKLKNYRYLYRKVDGKIKYFSPGDRAFVSVNDKGERKIVLQMRANDLHEIIQFEDGTYCYSREKDFNGILLPHLFKCADFKALYEEKQKSGDNHYKKNLASIYDDEHITKYNELCK